MTRVRSWFHGQPCDVSDPASAPAAQDAHASSRISSLFPLYDRQQKQIYQQQGLQLPQKNHHASQNLQQASSASGIGRPIPDVMNMINLPRRQTQHIEAVRDSEQSMHSAVDHSVSIENHGDVNLLSHNLGFNSQQPFFHQWSADNQFQSRMTQPSVSHFPSAEHRQKAAQSVIENQLSRKPLSDFPYDSRQKSAENGPSSFQQHRSNGLHIQSQLEFVTPPLSSSAQLFSHSITDQHPVKVMSSPDINETFAAMSIQPQHQQNHVCFNAPPPTHKQALVSLSQAPVFTNIGSSSGLQSQQDTAKRYIGVLGNDNIDRNPSCVSTHRQQESTGGSISIDTHIQQVPSITHAECPNDPSSSPSRHSSDAVVHSLKRSTSADKADSTQSTGKHKSGRTERSLAPGALISRLGPLNAMKAKIIVSSVTRSIDSEIEVFCNTMRLSDNGTLLRNSIRSQVEAHLRTEWPTAVVQLFGSSVSSLSTDKSDVDMTLLLQSSSKVSEMIEKIGQILQDRPLDYENLLILPKARVPICKFKHIASGLDCDIGFNNMLAVKNTSLIRDYLLLDPRARQLCVVVKHWAKSRKINDPYRGTLSSYAWTLLVINFLQSVLPPVLPVLQLLARPSDLQPYLVNGFDTYFFSVKQLLQNNYRSQCQLTATQLLTAFFRYYAHDFDFKHMVVSVRLGGLLHKHDKASEWRESGKRDKHLFSIEDPFDVGHDLGRVVDGNALYQIRGEFMRAYRTLNDNNAMNGSSLWQKLIEPFTREWRGS